MNLEFTEEEIKELADAIAATKVTANLLGRARIRLRLAKYNEGPFKFSDPTPFESFQDLKPLAPRAALDYFLKKVPLPGINAKTLEQQANREAFTLAVDTTDIILERVKGVIADVLEMGDKVSAAPRTIARILSESGVSEGYAETVFRTNVMSAYNEGSQQEQEEVADDFPVFQYSGIDDDRIRDAHSVHNEKYFSVDDKFVDVRDSIKGDFDGFNCRCTPIPIHRSEWLVLQANGAELSTI